MTTSKETFHSKWIGLLMGLIFNGSAHFITGQKRAGIIWYLSIFLCGCLIFAFAIIPGTLSLIAAACFLVARIVAWLVMLKQSFRPVPKIGIGGWIAVIALSMALNATLAHRVKQFVESFKLPSATMQPTLLGANPETGNPGDHVFANKISYHLSDPQRGDIIVFSTTGIPNLPQGTFFVQRIAGLPGERISIQPPHLVVDGPPYRPHKYSAPSPPPRTIRAFNLPPLSPAQNSPNQPTKYCSAPTNISSPATTHPAAMTAATGAQLNAQTSSAKSPASTGPSIASPPWITNASRNRFV